MRISMIPFGLLSGFMDSKEIRITELGEDGFRYRLARNAGPEQFLICFYDMKKAGKESGDPEVWDECSRGAMPAGSTAVERKRKYFYTGIFCASGTEGLCTGGSAVAESTTIYPSEAGRRRWRVAKSLTVILRSG